MSFFKSGKGKGGDTPPTGPTDKETYSFVKQQKDEPESAPAPARNFLKIVRGQGAAPVERGRIEPQITTQPEPAGEGGIELAQSPAPAASSGGFFKRPASRPAATEPPASSETPQSEGRGLFGRKKPAQPKDEEIVEPKAASGFLKQSSGGPRPELEQAMRAPDETAGQEASNVSSAEIRTPLRVSAGSTDESTPAVESAVVDPAIGDTSTSSQAPATKKSFLGLGSRKTGDIGTDKTEKTSKQPRKKAEKKSEKKSLTPKKSKGTSAKETHIYVQLDGNQKEFFWALRANGIEEVSRESVTRAASFSKDDYAIKALKSLSHKAAEDLALQEIGEPVHLVNRSRDLGFVYATREERALTSTFRLAPGQQVLDKLLKRQKVAGKHTIAGFTFLDSEGRTAVAVLYYISPEGEITKPQVTLNPDKMEFVLGEFAKQRKLNRKDAEVVLFSNADFLSEAATLQSYPIERVWRGVPVSQLWRVAAMVAGIGAIGTLASTGLAYMQVRATDANIVTLQARQDQAKAQASRVIANNLYAFSHALSVDESVVFDTAQEIWRPGTRLVVEAKLDRATYTVHIPVVTNKTFNNKPSVDATPPKEQVDAALQVSVPPGCRKDITSVSGNLNEVQISVVCENRRSPLSGFRND
jgi:hypothetical protein